MFDSERKAMEEEKRMIARARQGDTHAFAMLYETIYEDLYRYAFYMLQSRHDAEDAVSEAVLAAFSGIRNLREEGAFRGWMFQIVTNICKMRRKQYLKKEAELSCVENMDCHSGKDWVDAAVTGVDIRKALSVLREEERQIVGMSVLAGYTSKEIGEYMGMRPGTVRSKLKRSLEKVRNMLG